MNHLNAEKKAELFAAMQEGNEHYWEASATKDTVRSIIRDADPDHDSRGGSYSLRLNELIQKAVEGSDPGCPFEVDELLEDVADLQEHFPAQKAAKRESAKAARVKVK